MTTAEVAQRYRRAIGTLHYWRHIGYGPRSVKAGRSLLYPRSEVERFDAELAAQISDAGGAEE